MGEFPDYFRFSKCSSDKFYPLCWINHHRDAEYYAYLTRERRQEIDDCRELALRKQLDRFTMVGISYVTP
jgi:hypothetical protein